VDHINKLLQRIFIYACAEIEVELNLLYFFQFGAEVDEIIERNQSVA